MSNNVSKNMVKALNDAIAEHNSMDALCQHLNTLPGQPCQLSKSTISRIVTGKTSELRAATRKALEPVFSKYISPQDLTETDIATKIPLDEVLFLDTYRELSPENRRQALRLLGQLSEAKP